MGAYKKKNIRLAKAPPCPDALILPEARKHWEEIMPRLVDDGVIYAVDISVIQIACQMWALHQEFMSKGAVKAAIECQKQYISILKMYGASPKSRADVKQKATVDKTASKEADKSFEEDFGFDD